MFLTLAQDPAAVPDYKGELIQQVQQDLQEGQRLQQENQLGTNTHDAPAPEGQSMEFYQDQAAMKKIIESKWFKKYVKIITDKRVQDGFEYIANSTLKERYFFFALGLLVATMLLKAYLQTRVEH